MAAPKPGKKFKYDLDSVLKVRGIREKKEQEKFAEKQQEYLTEKQKEEQIKEEKLGKEAELRNVFKKGPISDFDKVLRRKAHLEVLKGDLDQQIEKVLDSSKQLEEQRAHLVEAMKNKKIMETHREHKLDDYNKVMRDLDMKFMDEIATQRFKKRETT